MALAIRCVGEYNRVTDAGVGARVDIFGCDGAAQGQRKRGLSLMDARDVEQMKALFVRMAESAKGNPDVTAQVRDALAESGLLAVFGTDETLDVVDLLDLGGEAVLRTRLRQMTLSELKAIVSARQYDPEKESARWRSPNKFIDLIVSRAQKQLEEELAQEAPAGAAWML